MPPRAEDGAEPLVMWSGNLGCVGPKCTYFKFCRSHRSLLHILLPPLLFQHSFLVSGLYRRTMGGFCPFAGPLNQPSNHPSPEFLLKTVSSATPHQKVCSLQLNNTPVTLQCVHFLRLTPNRKEKGITVKEVFARPGEIGCSVPERSFQSVMLAAALDGKTDGCEEQGPSARGLELFEMLR